MKRMIVNDEPRSYRVKWEIDIEAMSPQHAAMEIAKQHFNHRVAYHLPDTACVFEVLGYRCKQGDTWHEQTEDTVDLSKMAADMSAADLRELYGIEGHPTLTLSAWKNRAINGGTLDGYWEWMRKEIGKAE